MARRTENNVAALPLWARQYIQKLEADLKDMGKELDLCVGRSLQSSVRMWRGGNDYVYLPSHPIEYSLGGGHEYRDKVCVTLVGHSLNVRGLESLTVNPVAANSIDVYCASRFQKTNGGK